MKKPPEIIPINGRGHYHKGNSDKNKRKLYSGEIHIDMNNGHAVQTAQHEFGHWQDWHSRFRQYKQGVTTWSDIDSMAKEFNEVCEQDWNSLKNMVKAKYPSGLKAFEQWISLDSDHPEWNTGDYFHDLSIRLFGKSNKDLNKEEKYILGMYKDTVGSITNARYGGGHTKKEYIENSYGNQEAYANAISAWKRKDAVFKLDFPNIWSYIDKKMRGVK